MKLKAKSARGKQLLKQWGTEWDILKKGPTQFAKGIMWYIVPAKHAPIDWIHGHPGSRWMHPYNDDHLEVDDPAMDIIKQQPGLGR